MPADMKVRTYDELTASWPAYYGIKLSDVGEDGDVLVLGHHDEPRRVVAALNRNARTNWGSRNLCDDIGVRYADVKDDLTRSWAKFILACEIADQLGHNSDDDPCWKCREIAGADWYVTWSVDSTDEGAFPVTRWSS